MHGTNSHDRAIGAAGVLRSLVDARRDRPHHDARPRADAIADDLAARAANVHFEDQFERGEMRVRLPDAAGAGDAEQRAGADAGGRVGSD